MRAARHAFSAIYYSHYVAAATEKRCPRCGSRAAIGRAVKATGRSGCSGRPPTTPWPPTSGARDRQPDQTGSTRRQDRSREQLVSHTHKGDRIH
jgi:hypothetical protein